MKRSRNRNDPYDYGMKWFQLLCSSFYIFQKEADTFSQVLWALCKLKMAHVHTWKIEQVVCIQAFQSNISFLLHKIRYPFLCSAPFFLLYMSSDFYYAVECSANVVEFPIIWNAIISKCTYPCIALRCIYFRYPSTYSR